MCNSVLGSLGNDLAQRSDLLLECHFLEARQRQHSRHSVQIHVHNDVASQRVLHKHPFYILECWVLDQMLGQLPDAPCVGKVFFAVVVNVHRVGHTLAGCHVAHQLCDACAVTTVLDANQTLHIIFGSQLTEQLAVDAVLGQHVDVGVYVAQRQQNLHLLHSLGV